MTYDDNVADSSFFELYTTQNNLFTGGFSLSTVAPPSNNDADDAAPNHDVVFFVQGVRAVPEPAAMSMFAVACMVAALRRRRSLPLA